jgi:DNA polymerase-3 subunit delta'
VIRDVCDRLALTTSRGPRKIAIVEDADDLNEESSNCFLKTLEEPPPRSLLILIGETAERQLPTIRSRCQVVRFSPLPPDVMEAVLQAEGISEAGAARELARQSGGRPGLARELAAAELWTMRTKILMAMTDPGASFVTIAKDVQGLVQSAGKDGGAQRRRASALIQLLIEALRQALAPNRADDRTVATLARSPQDQLLNWLERCLAAEEQVQRRVQLVLVLEALIDGLLTARAA